MINHYGADSVRWFILSDSPPEKDIQWSDTGVSSANKFLQKIWNLNVQISKMDDKKNNADSNKKFAAEINSYLSKIDSSINNFRFNVTIANFYEVYKVFKNYLDRDVDKKILKENIIKIMQVMMPFTPHLAHECLELLNFKSFNEWPKIISDNQDEKVRLAIQINGKTRDVIDVKKNLNEKDLNKVVVSESKAKKYLENKNITKTIFVQNKIINYIIQNK